MTISERLAKLERDNRRCQRLLVGLVLLFGVTLYWTMGYQSQTADAAFQGEKIIDNLRVRELQVVDQDGKDVIILSGTNKIGKILVTGVDGYKTLYSTNGISLYNKQEKNVGMFYANARGGNLTLTNALSKRVVQLGNSTTGRGTLSLLGEDGSEALYQCDGFNVTNSQKKTVAKLFVNKSDGGTFGILNSLGKSVVGLTSSPDNGGSIYVHDVYGKLLWSAR